jgi:hypothetical protein
VLDHSQIYTPFGAVCPSPALVTGKRRRSENSRANWQDLFMQRGLRSADPAHLQTVLGIATRVKDTIYQAIPLEHI